MREEFPYVYVFAAEDLSSDTILIAQPRRRCRLDLDVIEHAFRGSGDARRGQAAAASQSPHDVFAYLLLGPEELESFTAGSPINTDDNARIEFAAPRDLLGYAKFDPYLAKVYGPHVALRPPDRARAAATTAPTGRRSAPGGQPRRAACSPTASRARPSCGPGAPRPPATTPEAGHARLLLRLVSTRLDRDPEIPARARRRRSRRRWSPRGRGRASRARRAGEGGVPRGAGRLRARRYATAYKILEKWPEELWTGLGPGLLLLSGFLDYKAEFYSDAVDELKTLADDATYVARRPELLYYLGRSHYANAAYTKAVDALERYIRSQTVLGRELLPVSEGERPD